eukprot:IDg4350t1
MTSMWQNLKHGIGRLPLAESTEPSRPVALKFRVDPEWLHSIIAMGIIMDIQNIKIDSYGPLSEAELQVFLDEKAEASKETITLSMLDGVVMQQLRMDRTDRSTTSRMEYLLFRYHTLYGSMALVGSSKMLPKVAVQHVLSQIHDGPRKKKYKNAIFSGTESSGKSTRSGASGQRTANNTGASSTTSATAKVPFYRQVDWSSPEEKSRYKSEYRKKKQARNSNKTTTITSDAVEPVANRTRSNGSTSWDTRARFDDGSDDTLIYLLLLKQLRSRVLVAYMPSSRLYLKGPCKAKTAKIANLRFQERSGCKHDPEIESWQYGNDLYFIPSS